LTDIPNTAIRRPFTPVYFEPDLGAVIAIMGGITVVRIAGLMASNVDLFVDESQYWSWSRELAWGYFSKPPLLAWIINLTTVVCGDGEACVRAPTPVLHFGTSIIIYLTARRLYGQRVGFWAALLMMMGPGMVFSARIISTDVPLIFFWALALLAYIRLIEQISWRWATVLGLALGMGLLAKYAMAYFLLGMMLAAFFERRALVLLKSRVVWVTFAIAAVIIAPNLLWLAQHNWASLRNIVSVIQSDEIKTWTPGPLLEFFAAQFAVFGPVVFTVLLIAIARFRSPPEIPAGRLMLAFAIPPIAIIALIALISHAYANWAAPAVVSATIFAAAILVSREAWCWLAFSLGLGALAQAALLFGDASAYSVAIPFMPPGKSDVYNRTLGFRALGDGVGRFAAQTGAATIVGENRYTVAGLLYYQRNTLLPILAWPSANSPSFELTRPLTVAAKPPVLFVTGCPFAKRLYLFYDSVEMIGEIHAPTGPTSKRNYAVFKLEGANREPTALPECVRE
jgi:4-amino-4-deoxy-L-arabinose transferase-like glycosyltransferase